jgi:hypothetical protein
MGTVSGAQACKNGCNLLITDYLVWWRRGESEYSGVLKTRRSLIFRHAKNAEHGKIAANWNVSGTRTFQPTRLERFLSGHYCVSLSTDLGRLHSNFPESRFWDRFRIGSPRDLGVRMNSCQPYS